MRMRMTKERHTNAAMPYSPAVKFSMIQHNIGRRQDYANQIIHKDVNKRYFRRTVRNYLETQLSNNCSLVDVYTLQEVMLERNILDMDDNLFTQNKTNIYYDSVCKGIYLWFIPPYDDNEEPVYLFLSEPITIGKYRYQYFFCKTASGLIHKETIHSSNRSLHEHGVAVVFNMDTFELQERRKRGLIEKSIYNELYKRMINKEDGYYWKKYKSKDIMKIDTITKLNTYRIPKLRYSPVVILKHRLSEQNYGFISFHGKIVNMKTYTEYYSSRDIRENLEFYHDTYKIKKQLQKEYPVFMGADLNVDLCNTLKYFLRYHSEYNRQPGYTMAKNIFLKHFESYKKRLNSYQIDIHPNTNNRCTYSDVSSKNFHSLIDYILFHSGSMLPKSKIKIVRQTKYISKNRSKNEILKNDYDHMPLLMEYEV